MNTPLDLVTVEAFLNTLDERSYVRHGHRHRGGDTLSTPAALTMWLAERRLINHLSRARELDLELALELRAALRTALRLRTVGRVRGSELVEVNGVLDRLPLRVACTEDGVPSLVPEADGIPGALARIAAAAVCAHWSGEWLRLKTCAAEDCRWVFYDGSRNGGGRWCSMRACGNRDKIRAYRERKAA